MIVRLLGWVALLLIVAGVGALMFPEFQRELPAEVELPTDSLELQFHHELKKATRSAMVGADTLPPPGHRRYRYRVRIGSFRRATAAEQLRAMLLLEEGLDIEVEITASGLWQVQTGLLPSKQEAQQLRERLLLKNLDAKLIGEPVSEPH